jgi:hypothetical protein
MRSCYPQVPTSAFLEQTSDTIGERIPVESVNFDGLIVPQSSIE